MRCSVSRAIEAVQFLQLQQERPGFPTGPGVVLKFDGPDSAYVHRPIRTSDTTEISKRDALRLQSRIRRARKGAGRVVVDGSDGQQIGVNLYPFNAYRKKTKRVA